jgi:hypothetical protein
MPAEVRTLQQAQEPGDFGGLPTVLQRGQGCHIRHESRCGLPGSDCWRGLRRGQCWSQQVLQTEAHNTQADLTMGGGGGWGCAKKAEGAP